jgi:hypothetical protein
MTEIFRGLPQSLQAMPDIAFKFDRFHLHPFQFSVKLSHFHSTLYSLSY